MFLMHSIFKSFISDISYAVFNLDAILHRNFKLNEEMILLT